MCHEGDASRALVTAYPPLAHSLANIQRDENYEEFGFGSTLLVLNKIQFKIFYLYNMQSKKIKKRVFIVHKKIENQSG